MGRFDKKFYNTKQWHIARARTLRRDGKRCVKCDADVSEKGKARVDHILSRRERPDLSLSVSNLRTLCAKCDNHRHHGDKLHKGKGEYEVVEVGLDGLPTDPDNPWFSAG